MSRELIRTYFPLNHGKSLAHRHPIIQSSPESKLVESSRKIASQQLSGGLPVSPPTARNSTAPPISWLGYNVSPVHVRIATEHVEHQPYKAGPAGTTAAPA